MYFAETTTSLFRICPETTIGVPKSTSSYFFSKSGFKTAVPSQDKIEVPAITSLKVIVNPLIPIVSSIFSLKIISLISAVFVPSYALSFAIISLIEICFLRETLTIDFSSTFWNVNVFVPKL